MHATQNRKTSKPKIKIFDIPISNNFIQCNTSISGQPSLVVPLAVAAVPPVACPGIAHWPLYISSIGFLSKLGLRSSAGSNFAYTHYTFQDRHGGGGRLPP